MPEDTPVGLVDSHCHLDFPELKQRVPELLAEMASRGVLGALCVSVCLEDLDAVVALAEHHANLWASVGVHPGYRDSSEPTVEVLLARAGHPKVIAVGETGLDYSRQDGDMEWQRARFRTHLRAARVAGKPLIIHSREAAADTLRLMREENAGEVGGVMHCFTDSIDTARESIEMGFYISFSGIVTFKNAEGLRAIARDIPLDRILVETDSPYLAPVPHRGEINQPAFVRHVAEVVAGVRGITPGALAAATTRNFVRLFPSTAGILNGDVSAC